MFHAAFEPAPKPSAQEKGLSPEEMQTAKEAFEAMAQRLDVLWHKKQLSTAEQNEVNLILNNAIIVQEILEGRTPEEFHEAA